MDEFTRLLRNQAAKASMGAKPRRQPSEKQLNRKLDTVIRQSQEIKDRIAQLKKDYDELFAQKRSAYMAFMSYKAAIEKMRGKASPATIAKEKEEEQTIKNLSKQLNKLSAELAKARQKQSAAYNRKTALISKINTLQS